MKKSHRLFGSMFLAGAMLAPSFGSQVFAEEKAAPVVEEEGPAISGLLGADFNSHFISWGYDVWGVGNEFGTDSTFNPYAEIGIDFTSFKFVAGTWWDVNSNVTSAIGGNLQEVDIYFGVFIPVDKFTFGIMYQDWMYAGQVEKVFDFSVAYDDSDLLGKFKMSPKFTAHKLSSGGEIAGVSGSDKDSGWAFLLSLTPGFTLMESESFDVALSFPIGIGFGDGDFYEDSGFAYVSLGVAAAIPLKFIPAKYGAWTISAAVVYYHTDDATIPVNPDNDFITAKVGFSVAF